MGFPSILPVQFVAMPSILKSMGIAHASAKTENINTNCLAIQITPNRVPGVPYSR
jgi:hypothetical protein